MESQADLRSRLEQLQTDFALVTELFSTFSRTLKPPVICGEVARVVWELTGAALVRLRCRSFGEPWQALTLANGQEDGGDWDFRSLSDQLEASGEPLTILDDTAVPGMGSYVGIPLKFAEAVIGTLEAASLPVTDRLDDTLRVLQFVAGMAAVALNNALLAEQAARAAERFRMLAENARDLIVRRGLAPTPTYEYVSPSATAITGYSPEEWYANPDLGSKIVYPGDLPLLATLRRDPASFPNPATWRCVHKDGHIYWVETQIVPVYDDRGTMVAFETSGRDITERVRAQQEQTRLLALAEDERKRLEGVVDSSPVGILVASAGGQMLAVNREAQRIFRLQHQPEFGADYYLRAAVWRRPDGTPYLREALPLERALRRDETVRAEEVTLAFPDGHTLLTLVNATPLTSAEGTVSGAILVVEDLSSLDEMEKRRNEFLGMVSHELRTPLTAIKGAAATALSSQSLDYSESRELFRVIDQQSDMLRDLINNLLDMSRIEAGALSINPVPTDLRGVVQEALEILKRAMGAREIQASLPSTLPKVRADGRRVAQVLTNLLHNATKFSPREAPIAVSVDHDASYLTVRVQDHGRGIPPDKLPPLFKKFSQVHTDSAQRSGTGLGLAICKGIVEAHGGRIWANSPGEGRGTTFGFTLPVAAEAPAVIAEAAARAEHVAATVRAGRRSSVLSVDDDPQSLRYIRRTLEMGGYEAIVTGDPAQCIRLIQQHAPDLVLLDMKLPGTSGFDLLQRIRELSGVPVIFLTGSDQGDSSVRALKAGADDYVTKPFSPSELLARIEVVIRRRVVPPVSEVQPTLVLGDLAISFAERKVTRAGQPVSLTATEYKLLYHLASHPGQVLTHDQLLERVWGAEYQGDTELLRSMMRNLRRSLGDDARHPRYVLTEPQVGYRMAKP